MKKISIFIIFCIVSTQVILAFGTSNPTPSTIEIEQGESERFNYKIFAPDFPLLCHEELKQTGGLVIEFEGGEKIVNPDEGLNVFGTVTTPAEIADGEHTAMFCVVCVPHQGNIQGTGSGL